MEHDLLWRTTLKLPQRGQIGIFNRSYYEEVLIVRVHPELFLAQGLADESLGDKTVWKEWYCSIVDLEEHLHCNNTRVIKFFLHLSKSEQRKRFFDRIDDPDKNWKCSLADVHERKYWEHYMKAYEACLSATSSHHAPWYVVPADDKENFRLIVSQIVLDAFNELGMAVILTAVDGSERSAGVLRTAAEIALRCIGRVHLYRSVTIPQEFPAAARMPPDKLPAILVEEARRELRALAVGYPDVVIEEPTMSDPPQPWRGILETGARLGANLIVVGSHGYGGWDRVLGTTAANVVNRAHRSVLVVHDRPLVPGTETSQGAPE